MADTQPSEPHVGSPRELDENAISRLVYDAAIEVHRTLGGPGLLERIYEEALAWELEKQGVRVERQIDLPVRYKGTTLATPLRLDLLINDRVIVECKSTEENNPVFAAQALTYLRLTGRKLAMVVNFGQPLVAKGIQRVVNGL